MLSVYLACLHFTVVSFINTVLRGDKWNFDRADFVPSENTILELFTLPFSRIFVFKNKRKIGTRLPGGGTSLYKPYRYVPPHRVGFLRRFVLKTGIHFAHFGLESGVVFEGTTDINVFIVSIPNEYQSINQSINLISLFLHTIITQS